MMRKIIAQLAKDKQALEQLSKREKEAFTQGYSLYKKIMDTPESQKAATEEEITRAMDLIKEGKHSPDSGGEKGAYRKCLIDLRQIKESREKPKF